MADDDEYLEILDSVIAMARDAELEANASLHRTEQPADIVLNYAERMQRLVNFLKLRIPSRWRVDIE